MGYWAVARITGGHMRPTLPQPPPRLAEFALKIPHSTPGTRRGQTKGTLQITHSPAAQKKLWNPRKPFGATGFLRSTWFRGTAGLDRPLLGGWDPGGGSGTSAVSTQESSTQSEPKHLVSPAPSTSSKSPREREKLAISQGF